MKKVTNCKLCLLGVTDSEGLSQRELAAKYGIGSKSSVGRHFAHLYADEDPDDPSSEVVVVSGDIETEDLEISSIDINKIISDEGDSPEDVVISKKSVKQWQTSSGEFRKSWEVTYSPTSPDEGQSPIDVDALYERISRKEPDQALEDFKSNKALVVVWADAQVGKVDSRGGTPELIERVAEKIKSLHSHALKVGASRAVFLSAGDGVEGFNNTSSQQFLNDLSLMEQVQLEADFETRAITLLADTHSAVDVATVPSNHSGWRQGKGYLGSPSDDWGIHISQRIEAALALAGSRYGHVEFHYPYKWEEFMVLDVLGHGVGLVHGHQANSPEKMSTWWANQIQGGSLADAEILVNGHFHHTRIVQDGRHPYTRRTKHILQGPTLDNGSSWFENTTGKTSDAGLMVFEITKDGGFDLGSLTIL